MSQVSEEAFEFLKWQRLALLNLNFVSRRLTREIEKLDRLLNVAPGPLQAGRVEESFEQVYGEYCELREWLAEAQVHDFHIWNTHLPVISELNLSALRYQSPAERHLALQVAATAASKITEIVSNEISRLSVHRGEGARMARSASSIVDLAMHALPAHSRKRYGEEFRSELYELVQAKATPAMQVYYALRQLGRVWALRRVLKDPTTHPLEPLVRATCWVLSSETRTWLVIGLATLTALIDVVVKQGWGSALLAAPTAWIFHQGACWLRKRLDIAVVKGKQESEDGPPPTG